MQMSRGVEFKPPTDEENNISFMQNRWTSLNDWHKSVENIWKKKGEKEMKNKPAATDRFTFFNNEIKWNVSRRASWKIFS